MTDPELEAYARWDAEASPEERAAMEALAAHDAAGAGEWRAAPTGEDAAALQE
ncbi:hypothetical protein [Actinoplanes sp. NPDC026670]|uniref:hypothetical protein n=1 Tax=Actinoplanes sp. NPDC026670 TaxID=3154700 RepID=UPI0033D3BBDF